MRFPTRRDAANKSNLQELEIACDLVHESDGGGSDTENGRAACGDLSSAAATGRETVSAIPALRLYEVETRHSRILNRPRTDSKRFRGRLEHEQLILRVALDGDFGLAANARQSSAFNVDARVMKFRSYPVRSQWLMSWQRHNVSAARVELTIKRKLPLGSNGSSSCNRLGSRVLRLNTSGLPRGG